MAENFYRASPVSRHDLRMYAKKFRKLLHLENEVYVDIVYLMENVLPELFAKHGFCFEIMSREQMGSMHGLTNPETGSVRIREDVYDGACRGVGRDRMTLAHELGHFLLHDGITLGLARVGGAEQIPIYCDPEWQASAFAGEFLVDHDLIRSMTPEEVADKCGVSLQAARIQKGK